MPGPGYRPRSAPYTASHPRHGGATQGTTGQRRRRHRTVHVVRARTESRGRSMSRPPDGLRIALCDGTFYGGDPFPAFAWMRDHAPAYFDEEAGVWGITRYQDVKDISKDPETFSNAGGIRPDNDALPMMIDFDAPEHVRRRRLVSEGFTPGRIRESRGRDPGHLRRDHRRGVRARHGGLRPRHRRPAPHDRDREHAGCGSRGPGHAAAGGRTTC